VVAGEDVAFFKTAVTRGLLADYCRRRATGEEISEVIRGLEGGWWDDDEHIRHYDKLLRMRDRENIATVALATKLRLTNQSRYLPDTAARAAAKNAEVDEPWRKSA